MKCYKFILDKWLCAGCAKNARSIVRDWVLENDFAKAPLYIKNDVYIYATDKDSVHMVIKGDAWKDLPSTLTNTGTDILLFLIDVIANRHDDDYDPEEAFYDYLTN